MHSSLVSFARMNGLGNKILVVDLHDNQDFPTQFIFDLNKNEHTSFEQLMLLRPAQNSSSDFFVEIFNKDASTAQACGNGTRCAISFLAHKYKKNNFRLQTKTMVLNGHYEGNGFCVVDMGVPLFSWQDIPLKEKIEHAEELQWGKLTAPFFVSMGNPHVVFFLKENVADFPLEDLAPQIQKDPLFPEGCNISIFNSKNRTELVARTYERGAGLTSACGSGACAIAVAAISLGLVEEKVTTHLTGGDLLINWKNRQNILMYGPSVFEHRGFLDLATRTFYLDS